VCVCEGLLSEAGGKADPGSPYAAEPNDNSDDGVREAGEDGCCESSGQDMFLPEWMQAAVMS